jgi:pyridoxal 5'-phosphate synthase pdxT subunit
MKLGVLDIQGSVEEHFDALSGLGSIEPVLVKRATDFEGLDGLIIPGGESTTVSKIIDEFGLRDEIVALAKRGGKIFGTCAGAILLARKTGDSRVEGLGLIDISVDRNAYGHQTESFETEVEMRLGDEAVKIEAVFIRAPKITQVGDGCDVLATYDGDPVLVREGNMLVSAFHPEMTSDKSLYEWFFDKP